MSTADPPGRGFFGRLFGREPEPERLVVPRAPTSDDLLAALDRTAELVRAGALPGPVVSRVNRVSRVVRDTIPRLANLGAGSPQAYSVMATATDYLPEAIGGYLRLPRQFADNRPVDRGKTSLMILIDQLDLLGATMDQVFDAVCRADAAALVAHGRFLEEKFGHAASGGGLSLDPGTRIAPDPAATGAASPASRSGPAGSPDRPEPDSTAEVGRLQPPTRTELP